MGSTVLDVSLASYEPLTLSVALGSWTGDLAVIAIAALALGYSWCYRRAGTARRSTAWCFFVGLTCWLLSVTSFTAVYSPVLFWVRALQVLLLLMVAPFFIALGRPITTLKAASPAASRILDRLLCSLLARVVLSPLATSAAMLATPWLLYLTPWYAISMAGWSGAATRLVLVFIGFAYFLARLQVDPVPRRYSPLLSIGVSVVEGIADGVLGLTLWIGPVIAREYYEGLQRSWGPSMRLDQSIGAGILWILGDVLAIPFVALLLKYLGEDERRRAVEADEELAAQSNSDDSPSGLWWEQDPQLRERFMHR